MTCHIRLWHYITTYKSIKLYPIHNTNLYWMMLSLVGDIYQCWRYTGREYCKHFRPPGTTTHAQWRVYYSHFSPDDWVATAECLRQFRRACSPRRERSGTEWNGTAVAPTTWLALPGVHQEPLVAMVGSSCRAGGVQEKKRELVGLVTRRARERSGSVGVHSPNSASGCDRSYLTRLRSRHADSRQSVRFTRDRVLRDRVIRPIARRPSFLCRWPDLFPALGSIPISASNRTTLV